MKAAYLDRYGKEETLAVREAPMPQVGKEDVLVKVLYAAVNPLDVMIKNGDLKLVVPYKTPQIAGNEMVGIVERVGEEVSRFKPGERVYGRLPLDRIGAFAQYVSVNQKDLGVVPAYLSNEQAAATPLAALTIQQALDLMKPKAGSTIFISGASGSLGQLAVPIAKARGLKVIASGNEASRKRLLELGADEYLDYRKEDYSKKLHNVDYVLDTLGGKETEKQIGILKEGGHLVSLKGLPDDDFARRMNLGWLKQQLFKVASSKVERAARKKRARYDFVFVESNGKQLDQLKPILEEHQICPAIDSIYPLDQINEALNHVATAHARGKTLIKVAQD